jgi:hypothetical protein
MPNSKREGETSNYNKNKMQRYGTCSIPSFVESYSHLPITNSQFLLVALKDLVHT